MQSSVSLQSRAKFGPEWDRFADKFLSLLYLFLVCSYATWIVVCSFETPPNRFDDFIPLVHAQLLRQGYTPSIDFYSFYPPLNIYANAFLFKLAGDTIIIVRAFNAFLFVIVLFLSGAFFRRQFASIVIAAAAVSLLCMTIAAAITMAPWPGFAFSFCALLIYLLGLNNERQQAWLTYLSGLLTGIACMWRINFGGYVLIAVVIDLLLQILPAAGSVPRRWNRSALVNLAAYMSMLIVSVCLISLAIFGSGTGVAISQFVGTSYKIMALIGFLKIGVADYIACAIAFPGVWFFLFALKRNGARTYTALSAILCAGAMVFIAYAGRGHYQTAAIITALGVLVVICLHRFVLPVSRPALVFLLFYCGLLHYFLSRADWEHFRLIPIAYACLLALLVSVNFKDIPLGNYGGLHSRRALAMLTAAIFAVGAFPENAPAPNFFHLHASHFKRGLLLLADWLRHPGRPDAQAVFEPSLRADWHYLYNDYEELRALQYMREQSRPVDAFFVGVRDHSTAFNLNDVRMYWLAGRPAGVRSVFLQNRVTTEADVQRSMIQDMKRNQVRWVILDCTPDNPDEALQRNPHRGSPMLDDFIKAHFKEKARFGQYAVLNGTPSDD